MAILHTNITSSASGSNSTSSYVVVDALTDSVTLDGGASSYVVLQATVPIELTGGDNTIICSFSVDGVEDGPEMGLGFSDAADEGACPNFVWVMPGFTGTKTLALEWKHIAGTAVLDTGYTRSFQVIELLASEANLLIDVEALTDQDAPAAYADMLSMSGNAAAVDSSSVLVFLGNATYTTSASESADHRFNYITTREGPEISGYTNGTNDVSAGTMTWAKQAVDGDSHAFSWQWQELSGSPNVGAYNRSFQLLELLNSTIAVNFSGTSATVTDATGTYADIDSFTGSLTPDGVSSVVWMLANLQQDNSASTDTTADAQFKYDGALVGPESTALYRDDINKGAGLLMAWALAGWTGSKTVSLQWKNRKLTAAIDTGRTRSFQVIDIKAVAAAADIPVPLKGSFQNTLLRM